MAVVGGGAVTFAVATADPPGPDRAEVIKVIDGDTVDVRYDGSEHRIRLLNVDTPETKDPHKAVECLGPEATAFLRQQLEPGDRVRLEFDEKAGAGVFDPAVSCTFASRVQEYEDSIASAEAESSLETMKEAADEAVSDGDALIALIDDAKPGTLAAAGMSTRELKVLRRRVVTLQERAAATSGDASAKIKAEAKAEAKKKAQAKAKKEAKRQAEAHRRAEEAAKQRAEAQRRPAAGTAAHQRSAAGP